jgi:non-ribosomal peptide synthetase component E (peptide arylation enzyme)
MWDDTWRAKTIGAALDEAAAKFSDRVATVFHDRAVTYNELKRTSDLIARGFLKLGIGKGDKVAVWMAGYSEWAMVYFALMRLGAVSCPSTPATARKKSNTCSTNRERRYWF